MATWKKLAFEANIYPAIFGRDGGQRIVHGRSTTLPAFRTIDRPALALGSAFDFSVLWEGSQDSWSNGLIFLQKHDGTTGIIFGIHTDLKLYVTINGTTYYSTAAVAYESGETHVLGVSVARESTGTAGQIIFFADLGQLGNAVAITAGSPSTLTTTDPLYVSSDSGSRYIGASKACLLFNRALSIAEIALAVCNGVSNWDMWGSCVPTYSSNFSSATDGWNGTRCTRTANVDGIAGANDCLSVYASADASTTHYIGRTTLVPHSWYKITLDYFIPTGNTNVNGVRVGNSGDDWNVVGEWTTKSKLFYYTNPALVIWLMSNGSIIFAGAGSPSDDLLYLKNIVLEQIGAIASYDSQGMQPSGMQWHDSTPNGCHLVQPSETNGGVLQRSKGTFEIRWKCVWSGTHEAQYIGGFNQAIFPANGYIQSCLVNIEGSVIEDIMIGDGNAADYWVALTSGLTAGKRSVALAHRYADGANLKMVVDPDANFTGSIAFLFRGDIMEV